MINKTGPAAPGGPDPKNQSTANTHSSKPPQRGGVKSHPMTFLGMYFDAKDAQTLWNVIIQNVCNAINNDKQKSVEAIKKMKDDQDDS